MSSFSHTSAFLSLVTLWQNIGNVLKTPGLELTEKIAEWAGLLTDFIVMLQDTASEIISQYDIRYYVVFVIAVISVPSLFPSFKSGMRSRYFIIRLLMYIFIIAPMLLISVYAEILALKVIIFFVSPVVFYIIRYYTFKCWRTAFDDMKLEEDTVAEQKKIISEDLNMKEYLQEIKDKLQLSEPKFWTALIKLIIGAAFCGLIAFIYNAFDHNILYILPLIEFPIYCIPSGLLGLCACTRKLKGKMKVVLKKVVFKWLITLLNLCYIPLLTLFVQSMDHTTVQCPVGYYWAGYKSVAYGFEKTRAHCVPCGQTLENMFPGYFNASEAFMGGDKTLYNQTLRLAYEKWKEENPGLDRATFGAYQYIENTQAHEPAFLSNATCKKQCSGKESYVLAEDHAVFWAKEVIDAGCYAYLWVVVFVMVGLPVLYTILTYRAAKTLKTLAAYGHDAKEKWHYMMLRVETIGVSFCQEFSYPNKYWEVFKIIHKFLVMVFSTLSAHANKYIIVGVPILHVVLLLATIMRRPFFSKWNNYLDIFLTCLDILVSFIAFLNTVMDVDEVVNSVFVTGAEVLGFVATFVVMILNKWFDDEVYDPTRLAEEDEKKYKKGKEIEKLSAKPEKKKPKKRQTAQARKDEEVVEELSDLDEEVSEDTGPLNLTKEELNPINKDFEVVTGDTKMDRFVLRKRMTLLYMAYDLKINDVEFAILARFLRSFALIGTYAAYDYYMHGVHTSTLHLCINYFGSF